MLRLLFNPRRFFQERASHPPERRTPSILIATGFGPSTFAEAVAHRTADDVGLMVAQLVLAALFGLVLSPILFTLGYWLPLRLVAGSPVRPWESGGFSLAPAALGGVLMVLIAWIAPVLYANVALWLTAFFGIWSLVVLYQALLVRVPEERARFAIGACMVVAILLNGVLRAAA